MDAETQVQAQLVSIISLVETEWSPQSGCSTFHSITLTPGGFQRQLTLADKVQHSNYDKLGNYHHPLQLSAMKPCCIQGAVDPGRSMELKGERKRNSYKKQN